MTINWNGIKEECPKSFKLFIEYILKIKGVSGNETFLWAILYEIINKGNLCYCDIENFFNDNGTEIFYNSQIDEEVKTYYYIISLKSEKYNRVSFGYYKSRDEAKEKAIYKAFEILEGKL